MSKISYLNYMTSFDGISLTKVGTKCLTCLDLRSQEITEGEEKHEKD